jgi:uncharacterized OB-fold protein
VSASWHPLPTISEDSEEFWASTHEHAMKMQKCSRCGKFRFYPSLACHFCASLDFTWEPITGKGKIHSWTLLERARGNPFEDQVPINIGLVELEEGPIITTNLIGFDDREPEIDESVTLEYEDVNDEITLYVFRPDRG